MNRHAGSSETRCPESFQAALHGRAGPVILGVVLAIGMTWPLVLHLGSDIAQDTGDPLLDSWHVAWIGHAILNQPLDVFQANRFWPERDSLAFTDVLLGYAQAGLMAAHGLHAAVVVHNLLFLFAYALGVRRRISPRT